MVATTASSLAQRLRTDIDAGLWQAGTPLRQEELAARYGASRIPVREALQLLRAQGVVVIEPNRGAYVATLGADAVNEIFDLRVMLECHLLKKAIPRHDSRSLVRLDAAQSELELENERAGWLAGDRRFHEALYEPAALVHTRDLVLTLRAQVERYMPRQMGPNTRRAQWKVEHRALIACVRRKDIAGGLEALARHLDETRSSVLERLDPGP